MFILCSITWMCCDFLYNFLSFYQLDLKGNKGGKGGKDKTAQIDEQLQELRKEINQKKPKVNNAKQGKKKKVQNTAPVQTDATTSLVGQMQI